MGDIKNTGIKNIEGSSKNFVTGDMIMSDILRKYPEAVPALMECGMHCLGCPSSQMETLADACMVHGLNVDDIVSAVNGRVNG